jgi:squalene synthase HpnC
MGAPQASPRRPQPPTLDSNAVMARASGENFPVASRLLGRRARTHLLAIYGFARLCDEIGDAHSGDRLAALDWLEAELDRAYAGAAEHPLLVALAPTLEQCALPRQAFLRLIGANRTDQRVARYETWEDLRSYCHLSADPVGELVLCVFGAASTTRIALSDEICTALQLTEHLQDISEDLAAGRVYLPASDMRRFGVSERDLANRTTSPAVAALIAFQVTRARRLYAAGAPLISTLKGSQKLAVAAFIGGGRSALAAIERSGYDVLGARPRSGRLRSLGQTLTVLGARRP